MPAGPAACPEFDRTRLPRLQWYFLGRLAAAEDLTAEVFVRALERPGDYLARGLRRLTAEQREVLELRFVRGYSIAETQAVTGRTEESVKKLQARALQRLRAWLPLARLAPAAV